MPEIVLREHRWKESTLPRLTLRTAEGFRHPEPTRFRRRKTLVMLAQMQKAAAGAAFDRGAGRQGMRSVQLELRPALNAFRGWETEDEAKRDARAQSVS